MCGVRWAGARQRRGGANAGRGSSADRTDARAPLLRPLTTEPGRPLALRVVCGDQAGESYSEPIWVMQTRRVVTVARSIRRLTLRLPRDVSARATRCILSSGAALVERQVELHPAAGERPPPCRAVGRERVEARSSEALLLRVPATRRDEYAQPRRACLLPRGRSRLLDYGYDWSSSGAYRPAGFVLTGHWVAWTAEGFDRDTPPGPDPIIRQNLRVRSGPVNVAATPSYVAGSVPAIGLAPDGTAAWVFDPIPGVMDMSSLHVARAASKPVELDRAAAGTLSDPAVSFDGTTVSWRRSGVLISAPVP